VAATATVANSSLARRADVVGVDVPGRELLKARWLVECGEGCPA
jgi:hypothetical protein